jgi:hypothetical protein
VGQIIAHDAARGRGQFHGLEPLIQYRADKPLSNQRMKLSWRGGRLKGNGSVLMAAAAPRSLCAIR